MSFRLLYQEGRRRRMPMTRLADELILDALRVEPAVEHDASPNDSNQVVIPFPDAA